MEDNPGSCILLYESECEEAVCFTPPSKPACPVTEEVEDQRVVLKVVPSSCPATVELRLLYKMKQDTVWSSEPVPKDQDTVTLTYLKEETEYEIKYSAVGKLNYTVDSDVTSITTEQKSWIRAILGSEKMDSIIVKTTQSLTTAEDMRNQTKLLMQPYANWEMYLTPAPLSIAIMGELLFISTAKEFYIDKNNPKNGYKFIKYPESFPACLMQVCNTGLWAFNEAHKNMDQIRLHTAQVPDYMKTAVKILFQGDDEVVKAHLPDQLDNIRVIADECFKLSDATEECFINVTKIIQELPEVCLNRETFYVDEIETIKRKLEETKLREQSAKEAKRRTEKAVTTREKEELTEILITMRNCELKEIDFKTTIEMLVKGMDAMGRVKRQWEKMIHFFQMVSNIVKISLSKTLTNFVSTSEEIQALSYNAKLFSKDLLYAEVFQACNIASLVHMISGTYTDISNKYLMDLVSSLGKLMVMDKSKPEFEHERHRLQFGCDEVQKGILSLVLENKEEFDRKITARFEKIYQELLAILPAAPPEQIKSIQEVVQAGFTEEEAASYY